MKNEISVVGQNVIIKVTSGDDLSGPAQGDFTSFELQDDSVDDPTGLIPKAQWTESLVLKKLPGGTGQAKLWGAEWVAGVESSKNDIPETTHLVEVVVRKLAPDKQIPATNRVRIPGFVVTELNEMKELMVHEFSRSSGTGTPSPMWEFDPEPLRKFIRSLTPQQRALLCSYDKQYLVVFISLRGNRADHLMCADECAVTGSRKSVLSNADFSVFSCKKKGHKVVLDLHTEYFCFNTQNTAPGANTPKFLNAIYSSLNPTGKHPRKLWLTAEPHEHVIYMTVRNGHYDFDEDGTKIKIGQSVMGGNYIHGIINTAGCWMLFRNYNWPETRRSEFLSLYIRDLRDGGDWGVIIPKLAGLGYDALTDDAQRSSSGNKWIRWDKNYGYNFFFERLVGVNFFAKVEDDMNYGPNLHNTHGHVQNSAVLATDEKSFEKAFSNPPEAVVNKIHHKKSGTNIGNGMWRSTNVRAMPTAGGWGRVFADCFIYNPDGLALVKLKESPYVEPPPPVPLPMP